MDMMFDELVFFLIALLAWFIYLIIKGKSGG